MLLNIRWSNINILFFFIIVFFYGITSIYLGKDVNWDLRNYHFYNSYSFLHNKLKYDYLAAQIQTFHNPFLHLIIYQLITNFPAKVAGFILGGIQGINCFIVLLIAQIILPKNYSPKWKLFVSIIIALFGAYSPMFMSEIGTTLGDNLTSLLVLIGFLFIFRVHKYNYFLSGLFFGFSIGFKLTNLVYGLAIIIAVLIIQKKIAQKISTATSIIIGMSVGILVTGGYWMWVMLTNYQNPLFPYYNSIFKSPYFALINFRDERFTPKTIIDAISYPFLWALKQHLSVELPFRDLRWLIIGVLFIILVLNLIIKNQLDNFLFSSNSNSSNTSNSSVETNANLDLYNQYIILFTLFSFFIWVFQFGYQRYLIPLELMSGLATFCLLNQIIEIERLKINILIFLTILIIVTTQSPNWGRVSWNKYWLEVITPNIQSPDTTLVIMVGTEPTSYVIPFFPERVRFVRIESNLTQFKLTKNTLMEKEITEIIHQHKGNILVLSTEEPSPKSLSFLNSYNLQITKEPCKFVKSQFEQLKLCPLKKL